MNTLEDLNTYGNQTVTFTDERNPDVFFNEYAQGPFLLGPTGSVFSIIVPVDIIEIVRPELTLVKYIISVPTNHTLTWPTLPPGLTLSIVDGVQTVSGITSVEHWQQIKSPTITLPSGFEGTGTYTAKIQYTNSTGLQEYIWNVGVFRPTVALRATASCSITILRKKALGATLSDTFSLTGSIEPSYLNEPGDSFYAKGVSNSITNAPTFDIEVAGNYTITVTPSSAGLVNTITSAGSGGTTNFNATTKVYTISGTFTQVNSHLSTLSFTAGAQAIADFSLTYFGSNSVNLITDTVVQQVYSTEYLSAPRGLDSYTAGVLSAITNGPIISHQEPTPTSQYTMVVSATPSIRTVLLDTEGYYDYFLKQSVLQRNGLLLPLQYYNSNNKILLRHSSDSAPFYSTMVISKTSGTWPSDITGNVNPFNPAVTQALFYSGSDETFWGDWGSGETIISNDESRLVIGHSLNGTGPDWGQIYTYSDSSGSWVRDGIITNPEYVASPSGSIREFYFGRFIAMNTSGTILATVARRTSQSGGHRIYVYNRVGSSWTLFQTIDTNESVGELYNIKMSLDGLKMLVYRITGNFGVDNTSKIFYYSRSNTSGNFVLTQTLNNVSNVGVAFKNDATEFSILNQIYTLNSGSWTVNQTLPSGIRVRLWTGNFIILDDGNAIAGDLIYEKISGTYVLKQTINLIGRIYTSDLSESAIDYNVSSTNRGLYIFDFREQGFTWNSLGKTLTLTGTKSQINAMLDNLKLQTSGAATETFILTFDLTTQVGDTDSRTHIVTRNV